jgi:hypothetical protein
MRRIGVLMALTADDPESAPRLAAFAPGEEILPRASGRRKERLMGRIGFTMVLD